MFEIIYSDISRNDIALIHSQDNCILLKYKSLLYGDSVNLFY